MAYSALTFTASEVPTLTKWNQLWANDASMNDGTGIGSNAITTAKILDANVTPPKLSNYDWFKYIPGTAYSSVVAGTWTRAGANTSSGNQGWNAAQSNNTINEEVQYKTVLRAGTYSIFVHIDKDINRGILTVSVGGVSQGTIDCYNASRIANLIGTITTAYVLATSAEVTVNLKTASKNASSVGYYLTINAIEFVRTA